MLKTKQNNLITMDVAANLLGEKLQYGEISDKKFQRLMSKVYQIHQQTKQKR